ncbi:hypothetical protein ACFO4E_20895 [Nocardiopsis mangrovi]|uniref:Lantibiotic dehydratase n=1 Tax=Nocardiopsis mangrovi TaxID=1179818 RepID=A0ABV9E3Z9_9ACTN
MSAQWRFARRGVLRSAGFPVSWLHPLRSERLVELSRRVLDQERLLREQRGGYLGLLGEWRRSEREREGVRRIRRAERALRRLRPVVEDQGDPERTALLKPWNDAAELHAELVERAGALWAAESDRIDGELRGLAARSAVQDAVFANSPDAARGLREFAAGADRPGTRRVLFRYLQRFCLKTDTAGRHGPINYAELGTDDERAFHCEARGDGRSAQRHVRLSHWAAQAVADSWSARPGLAPLLRLYGAAGNGPVPPDRARPPAVAWATGRHTIGAIAGATGRSVRDVRAEAMAAQAEGALKIGIRVPATAGDPLGALRDLVPDAPLAGRDGLVRELDDLDLWCARFATAPLDRRERLLAEAERWFADRYGRPARQGQGEFYADRFLYTEEAVGNIERTRLGGGLVADLAEVLTPALELLASEAVEVRLAQQQRLRESFAPGAGAVAAEEVLALHDPGAEEVAAAREERWHRVLGDPDRPRVEVTAERLRDAGLIRDDLDDWPLFCAPDIMLVASSRAGIERGEFTVLLAEAHHICPPTQLPFVTFDPGARESAEDVREHIADLVGGAAPVLQGVRRENKTRDYTPAGQGVLWFDWEAWEPGSTASHRIGDCTVELPEDARPFLRLDSGRRLALFPEYSEVRPARGLLSAVSLPGIDKRPARFAGHTPRITIGRLVYQRERWDVPPPARPGSGARGGIAEYLAAWRWKQRWGMPDEVFVRTASGEKPFLLDFAAPVSVTAFLREVESGAEIAVEELLPADEDMWLRTAEGPITTELRLTAFRRKDGGRADHE